MEHIEAHFPKTAPGCYASPSVFSHDSDVCRACPSYDACAAECLRTLAALRDKINVDDILARHRKAFIATSSTIESAGSGESKPDFAKYLPSVRKPTEPITRKVDKPAQPAEIAGDDAKIIAGIAQVKARALAEKWCKHGLVPFIRAELQAGRDPFASQASHKFERVTCEELLSGAVTAQSLKKAFMSRVGKQDRWDEATAASHIRIIMPALTAFGIVQETSSGWVVTPGEGSDNV